MFSRTIALNNGHSSPSGLRFRPLLLLSWSVLLLSLTISTEASGQSSSCQSGFRLEQQRLRVILEPFRHRMKVRVEVQVHKMNKQPRWFFSIESDRSLIQSSMALPTTLALSSIPTPSQSVLYPCSLCNERPVALCVQTSLFRKRPLPDAPESSPNRIGGNLRFS